MRKLLRFLRPYWKLLIIGPFFKLLEAILELMLPFLMSKVMDMGVARGDLNYVYRTGGFMILIAVVGVCCALICQYSASFVAQGVGTDIRNELFSHILTLSNQEADRFGTSSLVNRITNDVNQVQWAVAMLIRLVIRAPFLCIGGLVMAFLIDFKMSLILVIVLPVFILILFLTMKKTVPLYKAVQRKLDKIALVLRENLNGIRVIRAFSKIDYENRRFMKQNDEYKENAIRVGKLSALLNPLTALVMNFSIGAILWYGGIRVNTGTTTTGEIMAFIGYVTQILAALIVVSNLVVVFTKAFASAARISDVLEAEGEAEKKNDTQEQGKKVDEFHIEFQHVSMNYEGAGENAIQDISFRVKKGDTIGIIGGTGSGKSTLVNLIPGFYPVSGGHIFIDGVDIKNYALEELRSKIAIVLQKSVLFSGSIAENLRWGKKDASMEEIKRAAEIAQATEFIEKMPNGFESIIQRGGVNVSGGQRQRLSIARAIIRQPEILILDDSFNALDFVTDAKLRKALKDNTEDMTIFVVSQRVSTIKNADQIFVMHDGKMEGMGTHEELLRNCSVYREICESQMQSSEVMADEA